MKKKTSDALVKETPRRFATLSSMEWAIVAQGIVGALALHHCFPGDWWKIFIAGFGLGFLFEASMEPLFSYNRRLSDRHCIGSTDVNFLFPLGWLEIVGTTAILAETIVPGGSVPAYIGAALIVGNLNEFLFYKLGFWTYNHDAVMFGNFRPLTPRRTVSGVPIQVVFGYFNVGILVYLLVHVLY